jgi:hypothetical protein
MGNVLARIFVTAFFALYFVLSAVIVFSIVKRWARPALRGLFPARQHRKTLQSTEQSNARS